MSKTDIIRKLTSRKFWLSVASFVTLILTANGASDNTAAQVTAIIMAGATVLGYILGEGLTDAAGIASATETATETAITEEDMNDEDDSTTEGVG
ncbi:MAG: hypothetical protein LIP12_01620 [Clostridiales bacterium]|nr:hypothetical protein [Clostridiales bacterium]